MSKQLKRDFRTISWFVTAGSVCYFFYSAKDYVNKPYAYIFGANLPYLAPIFLFWLIYGLILLQEKKNNEWKKKLTIGKINSSVEHSEGFNSELNILEGLLNVHAITYKEFEHKKKLLIRRTDLLVTYTEELKMNQMQLEKLKGARELGVISDEEYDIKIKKLFDVEEVITQRIERISSDKF
jgi:hypothetical protein